MVVSIYIHVYIYKLVHIMLVYIPFAAIVVYIIETQLPHAAAAAVELLTYAYSKEALLCH